MAGDELRHNNPLPSEADADRPYHVYVYREPFARFPYASDIVGVVGDLIIDNPPDDKGIINEILKKWGEVPESETAYWHEDFRLATKNKAIYGPLRGKKNYHEEEKAFLWVMGRDLEALYKRLEEAGYPVEYW